MMGAICGDEVFQSAPPRRGRRVELVNDRAVNVVSIRAPAKGATQGPAIRASLAKGFQSAPPRRGRREAPRQLKMRTCFNPRPREGGDPGYGLTSPIGQGFNPRPREGGDSISLAPSRHTPSFNPRPREGGDR